MFTLELFLKVGGFVALGALLTVYFTRITAKEANKLALRRLENEEEAALDKQRDLLLQQERELHEERIAMLKEQAEQAKARAETAEKEAAALRNRTKAK